MEKFIYEVPEGFEIEPESAYEAFLIDVVDDYFFNGFTGAVGNYENLVTLNGVNRVTRALIEDEDLKLKIEDLVKESLLSGEQWHIEEDGFKVVGCLKEEVPLSELKKYFSSEIFRGSEYQRYFGKLRVIKGEKDNHTKD